MTFSKSTQKEVEKFSKSTQEELKALKRLSKNLAKGGFSLTLALHGISTRNMNPEALRAHQRRIRMVEFLVERGEIPESYPSAVQPQNSRPKK